MHEHGHNHELTQLQKISSLALALPTDFELLTIESARCRVPLTNVINMFLVLTVSERSPSFRSLDTTLA